MPSGPIQRQFDRKRDQEVAATFVADLLEIGPSFEAKSCGHPCTAAWLPHEPLHRLRKRNLEDAIGEPKPEHHIALAKIALFVTILILLLPRIGALCVRSTFPHFLL